MLVLPGGTLRSRIACYEKLTKRFDENEIRHITKQAGAGLSFLHDRMLVHLDVKPGTSDYLIRKVGFRCIKYFGLVFLHAFAPTLRTTLGILRISY